VISEVLRHVLSHLVGQLVNRRLERDARAPAAQLEGQETWTLRHSRVYQAVWSAMTLLWAGAVGLFAWLGVTGKLEWRILLAVPLFAAALVFSAVMAGDAFRQEIDVSAWGLSERRGGAVTTSFTWSEVQRVEFVTWLDAYRIVPAQGAPVRINMHIQGLLHFKALLRQYAPASSLAGVRERIADLRRF
jgi:hypothetical protein